MKKTTCITLAVLLMACGQSRANFSGEDDFNDNSRNVLKWTEFKGTPARSLVEANGRLEMRSTGAAVAEPDWDSGVWHWIMNTGSTTQDWTVTCDTVNLLDETAMVNQDMWFGVFVARAEADIENGLSIEVNKSNFGTANHHVSTGRTVADTEVFDVEDNIASNVVTLRIQYDAFLQRLYCSYDEGNGFVDLGSTGIDGWGMDASDEFNLYLFGGTEETPVSSGQVYGDNFALVPTSEYVEPETIVGYHNFSGTDDFNDNSIDSFKWTNFIDGAYAEFTETNGRFEFTSATTNGTGDDRSSAWEWIANQGSYTQSWTITYQAVNTINETNLESGVENWFGVAVMPDTSSFSNTFDISVGKENYEFPSYDVGSEGSIGGVTVLNYDESVTSDSILLRLSYDALTQILHSSYDDGAGFVPLAAMSVAAWGMDANDRFSTIFYSGNDGMIVTSGQIYAENVIMEPKARFLHESGAELASHIRDVEIFAGYDLANGEYRVEFYLQSDQTFSGVTVNAPFGSFDCEEDWEEWQYEPSFPTNAIPVVDGDWQIIVTRTNGLTSTTTIPFMQLDGITPIPVVLTCPTLTSPSLPSNDWILAQNVTFEWDSDFDANANVAGIESWNAVSDADVEHVFYAGTLPLTHSYGPDPLDGGVVEVWIYNFFEVIATNADSIAYELGRFAFRLNNVSVIDPEWDEDLDGMSNEWELQYYGGVTNGMALADSDGDGCDDLTEFRAGSDPTNPASCFEISSAWNLGNDEFTLGWMSVTGREYDIYWTTNLMDGFELADSYISYPQNSYMDTLYDTAFYRLDIWRSSTNPNRVKRKEISIDGDASDWSGTMVQLTDPTGDGGTYSGLDITGITIAQGVTNLFFRIDRAGTTLAPTNESSDIYIDLESGGRGSGYNLNVSWNMYGTNASLYEVTDETNWVSIAWGNEIQFDDSTSTIEVAVPLEPMNPIDRYGINFFTHSTSNGNWNYDNGDNEDNSTVVIMPY